MENGTGKLFKKISTALLIVVLSLNGIPEFLGGSGTPAVHAWKPNPKNPEVTYLTRKTITFGSYEQDNDGNRKEPITWQILDDSDEENVLVISDKILDCKKYNDTETDNTWENCTLRKWLNGTYLDGNYQDGFLDKAFSPEEKAFIKETAVDNSAASTNGKTTGQNNTTDKVFLLSVNEATNPAYGFSDDGVDFLEKDESRMATVSAYAKAQNVGVSSDGTGNYWLRSPSYWHDNAASLVAAYGNIYFIDNCSHVNSSAIGVRPAMRIDLKNYTSGTRGVKTVAIRDVKYSEIELGTYNSVPIKWNVLSVNGDDAFLMSKDVLESKKYHKSNHVTWETCDLHSWLNGDFYNGSFSSEEKAAIIPSSVTTSSETVQDNIFILSPEELKNTDYGFSGASTCNSEGRKASRPYWTRINGNQGGKVDEKGYLNYYADLYNNGGVRPVLHVDLSKLERPDPEAAPEPTPDSTADDTIILIPTGTGQTLTLLTDKKYRFVSNEQLMGQGSALESMKISNEKIALIDANGNITLKNPGTTTLKLTVTHPEETTKTERVKYTDSKGRVRYKTVKSKVTVTKKKTIRIRIRVKKPVAVKSIKFSKKKATINLNRKNKTTTLKILFTPTGATNREVTIESLDPDIASVTQTGVKATITGLKEGTARIKATPADGGEAKAKIFTLNVVNKK